MKSNRNLFPRIKISTFMSLSIFAFTMIIGGPIVLALTTVDTTNKSSAAEIESTSTTTLFLPIIYALPSVILCDGKVYDGYNKSVFVLEKERDKNPGIQKIIRNCTFKNSNKAAIVINDAQNVLIEGNHFENIRTNIPSHDVDAISVRCLDNCNIDNLIIRNNSFTSIGADGILLGEKGRIIKNVTIENNLFQGGEDVGENGVDIKGVDGPVYIVGNTMFGFRPCESPSSNPPGNQDCTGSDGAAMVIHTGNSSGPATNVIVDGNNFHNNILGLVVGENANHITVRNNNIFDNLSIGLAVRKASNVKVQNNTFNNNPKNWVMWQCTLCTIE